MWNFGICDDNPASIHKTKSILKNYFEESGQEQMILDFQHTDDLYEFLKKRTLDVVFMDIVLSGEESGIEAARRVKKLSPKCEIVYLTNYLSYATDIFETDHCYFVLKNELEHRMPGLISVLEKKRKDYYERKLLISLGGEKIFIPYDEILYIEHIGRKIKVVCQNEEYWGKESMNELEQKLGDGLFIRCHKGFFVNWDKVKLWKNNVFYMQNGVEINVSRSYRDKVNKSFQRWRR